LVTGASRGVGKGIALQLGDAGAIVYVTARTLEGGSGTQSSLGTLRRTVKEIETRGGKAIPIACDHNNDADIKKLFQQIEKEQGRLDILVNNAYSAVFLCMENYGKPFWQYPENTWDTINGVGLRNHYLCSTLAARMMTKQKSGLIINVSSVGGKLYMFTPAYGIGKAAVDRMAADCGLELKAHNVTFISLWPGAVKTEVITQNAQKTAQNPASNETVSYGGNAHVWDLFTEGETIEFPGKAVVALATDPKVIQRTGKIITTASVGQEFGFKDIDGREIQWTLPPPA